MRVQCPLAVIGHQDFHLAYGQVLDVLVLGPRVLDIGLTPKTNGLIFVFEYAFALDRQRAPLLPHTGRSFEEVLGSLLVLGSEQHVRVWRRCNIVPEATADSQ